MSKNKYVIIHGQLHQVTDDELMHWKYIKREKKPGGGYRYYYRDDDYENAKENYKRAQRVEAYERKRLKEISEKNDAEIAKNNKLFNDKYGDKAGSDEHWPEVFDANKSYIERKVQAKTRHIDALKRVYDASASYSKAKKEYEKSAGHKVADFLNKTSVAANKAKIWLKSLF